MKNSARKYLMMCQDDGAPLNETLEEHRKHCEAKPGNCPFEKEAEKADLIPAKSNDILNQNKKTERENGVHKRVSEEALRRVHEGARILHEASTAARRGEEEGAAIEGRPLERSERAEEQELAVMDYAQEKGIWHKDADLELEKKYGEGVVGGEAITFFDEKSGLVHKTITGNYYKCIEDNLERVRLFNRFFPETALTITGFGTVSGEWLGNRYSIIADQPFIQIARSATDEEVSNLMNGLGFSKKVFRGKLGDRIEWENDEGIVISDLHEENVVVSEQGNVSVIDCAFSHRDK